MYNFESGMNLSHLIHVSNIRPLLIPSPLERFFPDHAIRVVSIN